MKIGKLLATLSAGFVMATGAGLPPRLPPP